MYEERDRKKRTANHVFKLSKNRVRYLNSMTDRLEKPTIEELLLNPSGLA